MFAKKPLNYDDCPPSELTIWIRTPGSFLGTQWYLETWLLFVLLLMIFIGRNPGPRYLVARREKQTTRWERRSKIFGSSQSVNCLVSNLQNLFHLCQFLEYPGTNTRTLLQREYSLLWNFLFPFNFLISS